nr:LamG domain-containing protein [Planctomycetota bacterium]
NGTAVELVGPTLIEVPPLGLELSEATMAGWIKPNGVSPDWSAVIMHRGTGLAHGFNMLADFQLAYHWNDDSNSWSFRGGDFIAENDWTFAAVTVAPDKATFYVNGEMGAVNEITHDPAMWDNNIYLGGDGGDDWIARRMNGALDDVMMYDRALSAGEIRYLSGARAMDDVLGADVTAAGDVVKGVPDEPRDGSVAGWPDGEYPGLAVDDDVSTKFLHFKGEVEPTGFVVEPASGASIVTGLTFTTANDATERDPVSFELSGSNDSIDGPYELIASGDIVDFAQDEAWPRFTMNVTPITFDNNVAYKYYQVMFPTVRDPGSANSMQIAEVELRTSKF